MAAVALGLAYWLRYYAFHIPIPGGQAPSFRDYAQASPALAGCMVLVFAITGNYSNGKAVIFVDELFDALRALGASAILVLAALSLYPLERFTYSRLTFILWTVAAGLMIGSARYAISKVERHQRSNGVGATRSLVVGTGKAANQLVQRIRMFPDFGYQLVGVLTNDPSAMMIPGVQVLGEVTGMADVIEKNEIDVVFIAVPYLEQERVLEFIGTNRRLEVEFRVVPSALEMIASQVEPDQLAGIPLLRIRRGLDLTRTQIAFKRLFDLMLSIAALILLSPVMAFVAVLIRVTSRGPIVISQERVGQNSQPFQMLKFRSMRADAEADTGPVWTAALDRRRTTVGRFLRRFSLDELPQLWNVLRGDMSLVGPRPERPVFVSDFGQKLAAYGDRHRVRPGLTGWAQVNDLRGMTSVADRLVYDLYYVERWSLAFDLKIVLTTMFRVFTSKNAY